MSEIADTGHTTTAINVVHESYAFACMKCGHGWEQSYEIEHHVDASGQEFVMYHADGQHVPSPLTRPTCLNCGGHVVRIMRAGQVSSVLDMMRRQHERVPASRGAGKPAPDADGGTDGTDGTEEHPHHWHLSDLLHVFHRKAG